MDKPVSLSLKDFLIRKLSVDRGIPETIIKAIVDHQFDGGLEALKNNDSIEFSSFGKFYFNKKKALKRYEKFLHQKEVFSKKLEEKELSDKQRHSLELKLNTALKNIEDISPKIL